MMNERDALVLRLWIEGYEFVSDSGDAHVFERPDGATVCVPKRDRPSAATPISTGHHVAHPSPCCKAESHVRRVIGANALVIYRCGGCGELWESSAARPKLRLVK